MSILLIFGIVLLLSGLSLVFITIEPIINAKPVEEIVDDWNHDSNTFKSYNKGDKIMIWGKIIGVVENKYLLEDNETSSEQLLTESFGAKYIFYIESTNLEIYSNEKIGNKGDYVILECKIEEITKMRWGEITWEGQIVEVKSYSNPLPVIVVGVVIIVISSLILIKSIMKRRVLIKTASKPYQIAAMYENSRIDDEEKVLVHFMKGTKEKNDSPADESDNLNITQAQPKQQNQHLSVTSKELEQPNVKQDSSTKSQITPMVSSVTNKYKHLQSEDDEIALYKSMHTMGEKSTINENKQK